MSQRWLVRANSLVLLAAVLTAGALESRAGSRPPAGPVSLSAPSPAPERPTSADSPVSTAPTTTAAPAPAESAGAAAPSPTPLPSTASSATPSLPPTPPPAPPPPRTVTHTGWQPYASVGPVALYAPGEHVELVGYHQSGHDGAQPQQPVQGAVRGLVLESRARDTHRQGASDIVVDPSHEVRSPVTGTVLRAGTYTLYCDHTDHYLVVEPDDRPGWEVKVLHFEGLSVDPGDRVEGGVTVIGARARVLPFPSQVDDHTAAPHWPHLHVEVVDPAVPDRPGGPGCR